MDWRPPRVLRNDDIANVTSDISAVNADLAAPKGDGITPEAHPNTARAAGSAALKNAVNATAWAQGQGKQGIGEAQAPRRSSAPPRIGQPGMAANPLVSVDPSLRSIS